MSDSPKPSSVQKMFKDHREGRDDPAVSKSLAGPSGSSSAPLFAPKNSQQRVFDDTILNENHALLRGKRKSTESILISEGTPAKASKQTESPWNVKYMRNEILNLKAENNTLHSQIKHLKAVMRASDSLHEEEIQALKKMHDRDKAMIHDLETRVMMHKSREEGFKSEIDILKKSFSSKNVEGETECNNLLVNLSLLSNKHQEANAQNVQLELALQTSKLELSKMHYQHQDLLSKHRALENELKQFQKSIAENVILEDDLAKAKRKISGLEAEYETCYDSIKLAQKLEVQSCHVAELEKKNKDLSCENSRLRQMTSNILKLETLVDEQKRQLDVAADKDAKLVDLGIEVGLLKARLHDFETVVTNVLGSHDKTALHLEKYIQDIHSKHLVAVSDASKLDVRLKLEIAEHESTKAKCAALSEEAEKQKKRFEGASSMIKRFKKQCAALYRERNDLKSLVESCKKKMAVGNTATTQDESSVDKAVTSLKQRVKDLENELVTVKMTLNARESMIDNLRKTKSATERELEKLKHELDHRALKGDFDLQNTKIIHMVSNPATIAHKQHMSQNDLIRKENAALRTRIRMIKDGQSSDTTHILMEKQHNPNELLELKCRVRSVELQNQRLKEAFKQTGHEFREAIHMLLGYKVDALPAKVYKLTNMYAESPEDYLTFKMSKGSVMEMLETNYSKTLTELIEINLTQHQSIPLFLASVTVDLFQKQTTAQ